MPLDLHPDKYRVNGATGLSEPVESTPYVRYVAMGRPTIYLQAGVYYYESGEVVPDEKVREYGLSPTFDNGAPASMSVTPEVAAILEAQKQENMKKLALAAAGLSTVKV